MRFNAIRLYPNPFNDKIVFEGIYISRIDRVRIFSLEGIKMYDEIFLDKSVQLNVLKSGVYLMDIETRNGKHLFRKIIKE